LQRSLILLFFFMFAGIVPSYCFAATLAPSPSAQEKDAFDQDFADDFADDFANEDKGPLIADPLEKINRGTFWVNDKLYVYVMKPVARGYRIVPRPVRLGVQNFFRNLQYPVRLINSVLQGKFADGGRESARFFVNTTLGIGGLFDVAETWGHLPQKEEDFGQTLGFFNVGQGFYLVLPLLGPSSLRDTGGLVVDTLLSPFEVSLTQKLTSVEYAGLKAGQAVNYLSLDNDSYEKLKRDSLDPYLFMRSAYAQYRVAKVAQ